MEVFSKLKNLFMPKPKTLEEGVDFKFFEAPEWTGVTILQGDFKGIKYHYGKTWITDQDVQAKLSYEYTVDYLGEHSYESLQSNEKFATMMGDILVLLLEQYILKEENASVGTYDSEESNL